MRHLPTPGIALAARIRIRVATTRALSAIAGFAPTASTTILPALRSAFAAVHSAEKRCLFHDACNGQWIRRGTSRNRIWCSARASVGLVVVPCPIPRLIREPPEGCVRLAFVAKELKGLKVGSYAIGAEISPDGKRAFVGCEHCQQVEGVREFGHVLGFPESGRLRLRTEDTAFFVKDSRMASTSRQWHAPVCSPEHTEHPGACSS